ncbi:general stress protein [Sporosarcina cyprini]|uniref:general stress protein n=1 Tax=Sporosarcina cyprini TaxID=2910523 RepID=UPI001EDDD34E|nr:general stress protein [Sporosarcina cyprini]MCG3088099.1 general stress protein [Sporosarcina cyprini]
MKKTFIGSFPTQERLISKIKELQRKGVKEDDMYIVMKDDLAVAELKSRTSQDIHGTPSSFFNRFLGFMAGEDNVRSMLKDAGFTDEEAKIYYNAVQDGAILLYIDGQIDKEILLDQVADESRYGGYDPISPEELQQQERNL